MRKRLSAGSGDAEFAVFVLFPWIAAGLPTGSAVATLEARHKKTSPAKTGRTTEFASVPLGIKQVRLLAGYVLRVPMSRSFKQLILSGSYEDREARNLQGCVEALLDVQALADAHNGNDKFPQAEVGLQLMRR